LDIKTTGRMERRTAQRAHAVSAPTRAISRIYAKRWGLKAVECFPNPMDAQIYMQKSGQGDYIIYTGRVEYRKGVHVLIKAYARLVKKGIDVPLVLAGAPYGMVKKGGLPYEKIITALIEENGLKEKVTWIKGPDRPEIRDLLGRARIAVYPSVWENFPYTCLEAMATGVPVVASRCGGYCEMIEDGKSGRLFTPLNAGELCDVLAGLLADADLSARLGRGGRQRVIEAYSVERVSAAAETFYERTAHG
jgi:glycosyltransferase involved in cell wall biosynthesis